MKMVIVLVTSSIQSVQDVHKMIGCRTGNEEVVIVTMEVVVSLTSDQRPERGPNHWPVHEQKVQKVAGVVLKMANMESSCL